MVLTLCLTHFFYKLYDKLFMNDFLDIIVKNYNNGHIIFKNKQLIVFDIGSYKGTFSKQLMNNFNKKKGVSFYLFDPLKKIVNFNHNKFKNFNFFDYALDSTKLTVKIILFE